MTQDEVKAALIKIIVDIQKASGLDCPALSAATKPLVDVPQFDSKIGAVAASRLAKVIGLEIPPSANIFVDKGTKANLTLEQASAFVLQIAKPKAKDAA